MYLYIYVCIYKHIYTYIYIYMHIKIITIHQAPNANPESPGMGGMPGYDRPPGGGQMPPGFGLGGGGMPPGYMEWAGGGAQGGFPGGGDPLHPKPETLNLKSWARNPGPETLELGPLDSKP